MAWKGVAPLKPPVSLEARMACAAIVDNAVVSSSCVTLDSPPAPLLEHIATPTLADYAEHAAHEKAKRKKTEVFTVPHIFCMESNQTLCGPRTVLGLS